MAQPEVLVAVLLHGGSREGCVLISGGVDRTHFHAAGGVSSPCPVDCIEGCPFLSETSLHSMHKALISENARRHQILLTLFIISLVKRFFIFKKSCG